MQAQAMTANDFDQPSEAIIVQGTLTLLSLVIVTHIDHAFESWVQVRHLAHGISYKLTKMAIGGVIAQVNPAVFVRDIETHNWRVPFGQRLAMIFFNKLARQFLVTKMIDVLLAFIIENI